MRPLLMIPGPIEISPAVQEAFTAPPISHVAPAFIETMGSAVERMRAVWCADEGSLPFILAGSGTIAMDFGVCNLLGPGDRALVVNTGWFSDRLVMMLKRRGAQVDEVKAPAVGKAPSLDEVEAALMRQSYRALCATHVDTSTGVRIDAAGLCKLARAHDALTLFDGVCATAAERFEMAAWDADVYLTGSQKAVGLPAGLALVVLSARALAAREAMKSPPPLSIDVEQWRPIMTAYEKRRPSYFSTPATNLVAALNVGLGELLDSRRGDAKGMEARFAQNQAAADAMRAAFAHLGMTLLADEELAANSLSAVRYPEGVDASLVKAIAERGVTVAGGLHPACKAEYFRVGHMGYSATQPEHLLRCIEAVAGALESKGKTVDLAGAKAAAEAKLSAA